MVAKKVVLHVSLNEMCIGGNQISANLGGKCNGQAIFIAIVLLNGINIDASLVPRPERGPGTHCLRMRVINHTKHVFTEGACTLDVPLSK